MRTTYITATVIAVILAAWLWSGNLGSDAEPVEATLADQKREQSRILADAAPTRVRVAVVEASEQHEVVKVRGKTENKRTVSVKVELDGSIVERPVDRGSEVRAGDTLCRISVEDRRSVLSEAREMVNQAQIEYDGALSLKAKGYTSPTDIAGAKARLATAEANLTRRQLDLKKLDVHAPFDGIVEDVHLEVGDYVTPGSPCATIVDMDPMLLVGRVSERELLKLETGQTAIGRLSDGRRVNGPVTFIGQQADPATRTYAVEIELSNSDYRLRSGITTEIAIPVDSVLAQKISPALFALDDEGRIGVRTVNDDNVVEYHHVDILADADDGVWVTGLPNRAGVIVVGQELVTAGERVDPIFQGNQTMPAQTPAGDGASTSSSDAQASPGASDGPGPRSAATSMLQVGVGT